MDEHNNCKKCLLMLTQVGQQAVQSNRNAGASAEPLSQWHMLWVIYVLQLMYNFTLRLAFWKCH